MPSGIGIYFNFSKKEDYYVKTTNKTFSSNFKIELSNLNRQVLYGHENIGESKAHVAKDKLRKINPYVKINAIAEFVNNDELQIERLIKKRRFLQWKQSLQCLAAS